jgi:thiol-disulfide isomerase/thioredoxin
MIARNFVYRAALAVILALALAQCAGPPEEARIVGLEFVQDLATSPGQEVRVINFWATWCAPCIKEMPLLQEFGEGRDDVRVTLVSLDLDMDPDPEKVMRFVKERNILLPVLILDAGNPNEWIDKIDSTWSGALPATLVVNSKTGKRLLVEKELHKGDLEQLVAQVQ